MAAIAVIGLRLKKPFLGPDISVLLLAAVSIFKRDLLAGTFAIDIWIYGAFTFIVLCVIRELFGWLCSRSKNIQSKQIYINTDCHKF